MMNNFLFLFNHQITQVVFDPNHWLIANSSVNITSVEDNPTEIKTYRLAQNYPNPFNPTTKIKFQTAHPGNVKLIVYDILGKKVKTLVNEFKPAGKYEIEFEGNNLPSGVYLYRIESENFKETKKMILLK